METFEVIPPSILLAPYVKQYWFMTAEGITQGAQRFLPAGSMGLAFNRGGKTYSDGILQPRASLFGQTTRYVNTTFENPLNLIVVIFQTVGAKAFFKIPLNELNGKSISIDYLYDKRILDLEKQLSETNNNKTGAALINQYLTRRIYEVDNYNFERMNAVMQSIASGTSQIPLLAETACLGYRQFKRVFTDYTGLNPVEYIQIRRFSKALHLLQTGEQISLDELSNNAGYYDKSHLIRDFKSLSGYTPREILGNSDPYSDDKALFQSFFIDTESK